MNWIIVFWICVHLIGMILSYALLRFIFEEKVGIVWEKGIKLVTLFPSIFIPWWTIATIAVTVLILIIFEGSISARQWGKRPAKW